MDTERPKFLIPRRNLEPIIIRAFPQLIGLGYMIYFFTNYEEFINPFLYCGLCQADVHFNNLIGHLVGISHRLKYCNFHFPLLAQNLNILRASCKDVLLDHYLNLVAPEISKLSSIKMPLGFAEGLDIETIRQQVKNGRAAGIHVNASTCPNLEQKLINICIENGIEAAVQSTEKIDLNGDPASLIINLILRLQDHCSLDSKKLNKLKRLAGMNKRGDRKFFEDHKQFLLECFELINKTVLEGPFVYTKNIIKAIIENKVQQVEEQPGEDHQPDMTPKEEKNLHLNFVLQAPGDCHDAQRALTPNVVGEVSVFQLLDNIESLKDHCNFDASDVKDIKILTEASIKLGPNSKILFGPHKEKLLKYRSKIIETHFDDEKLRNRQLLIVAVIKNILQENQEDNGVASQGAIDEDNGTSIREGLSEDAGDSLQDTLNEKQPSGPSSAASEDPQQADETFHLENDTQDVYASYNFNPQNTFAHEHYVSNLQYYQPHYNQPQIVYPLKYVFVHPLSPAFIYYPTAPGMTYDVYNQPMHSTHQQ